LYVVLWFEVVVELFGEDLLVVGVVDCVDDGFVVWMYVYDLE